GIRDKLVTGVQTCALPIWLVALTGPLSNGVGTTSEQTEPSFNATATTCVYIEKNQAGAVDLIEINLANSTSRSLVKANPNFSFKIGRASCRERVYMLVVAR